MIGDERKAEVAPATLAYGRLAIGALVLVTIVSAAALTVALAVVVTAPSRLAGLPYADIPIALIAIGASASLASLSSAAAYFTQVADDRGAASAGGALRRATFVLMTIAYLAFAAGGLAFTHFGWAAVRLLSSPR